MDSGFGEIQADFWANFCRAQHNSYFPLLKNSAKASVISSLINAQYLPFRQIGSPMPKLQTQRSATDKPERTEYFCLHNMFQAGIQCITNCIVK